MAKPSPLQRRVIELVQNELSYIDTSNDIHSPSHFTSIDYEMFSDLQDEVEEGVLEKVESAMRDLYLEISRLTPDPYR
jgi:hypothetical protein